MASEWFVKVMGDEMGPLSDGQLREMAAKRQLTPDDPIRKGPSAEWVPAARVRGLFQQSIASSPAGVQTETSVLATAVATASKPPATAFAAEPTFIHVSRPESSQLIACPDCQQRISRNAKSCPNCGRAFFRPSRGIAIALAVILGSFGAHKFYLRKPGQGVLYLIFCWTYIPGVIGIIEGLRYLFMDEDQFSSLYDPDEVENTTRAVATPHNRAPSAFSTNLPQGRRIQKHHWIVGSIAALILIGIIGSALEDNRSGGAGGRTRSGSSLRRDTPAAISSDVYDRMVDLAVAEDYSGLETLLAAGLSFQLPEGTQVRVIDLGLFKTEIKVESGEHAGRYLIVATENIIR